ncbi:MAG: hypothetical protein ACYC4R_05475 [Anaerolineae bacterium]
MGRYRARLARAGVRTCEALEGTRPNALVRVAGLVTIRQQPPTAHGMTFITLEDETGLASR